MSARDFFVSLWRGLRRRRRLGAIRKLGSMGDLPLHLGKDIYIVGVAAPKWAVLQCPCGCGERIDVNLMPNRRPSWQLALSAKGATLKPSLWVPANKCGSHFFVRESRILWVRDAHHLPHEGA